MGKRRKKAETYVKFEELTEKQKNAITGIFCLLVSIRVMAKTAKYFLDIKKGENNLL